MAFAAESDRLRVCEALGMTPDDFDAHLIAKGSLITSTIEARVLVLLTSIEAIPVDGIDIFPTESNLGVRKSIDPKRWDLQQKIANLLMIEEWEMNGGSSFEIVRG